jgi:phage tail tape-measure protein
VKEPLVPAEAAGIPVFGSIGALGIGLASVVVVGTSAPGLYCGSAAHGWGASLVSANLSADPLEVEASPRRGMANAAAAMAMAAAAAITTTARM